MQSTRCTSPALRILEARHPKPEPPESSSESSGLPFPHPRAIATAVLYPTRTNKRRIPAVTCLYACAFCGGLIKKTNLLWYNWSPRILPGTNSYTNVRLRDLRKNFNGLDFVFSSVLSAIFFWLSLSMHNRANLMGTRQCLYEMV